MLLLGATPHTVLGQIRIAESPQGEVVLAARTVVEMRPTATHPAPFSASDCAQATLVIQGIRSDKRPAVVFRVFIDVSRRRQSPSRHEPGYLGDISFFGFGDIPSKRAKVSFQIDDALARLASTNASSSAFRVSFIGDRAPAIGSNPSVGSISIWCAGGMLSRSDQPRLIRP